MSRRWVRLVALTVAASVAFSGLLVTAAEAKSQSYKPRGGNFFTLTWSANGPITEVKWGRINSAGIVKPLTGDLALLNVVDADYSPETGLVYVLRSGPDLACSVWTFDPDDVEQSLRVLTALNPWDGFAVNCTSLTVVDFIKFAVSSEGDSPDVHKVNYFSLVDGAWEGNDSGFDTGYTDHFPAMDWDALGVPLTIRDDGSYTRWIGDGISVSGQILSRESFTYPSVKFDQGNTPWVMRTSTSGVSAIGKMNLSSDSVKWGKTLRSGRAKTPWVTQTIVFIPNNR